MNKMPTILNAIDNTENAKVVKLKWFNEE